jgi:alpha-D-ribose 1-methylphosphonate 5-triphosphate synthase subunit PhnG
VSPEERFEGLAAAPASALISLADAVLAAGDPVEVVAGPEPGLVPVRVRPPHGGTVVISHVVLTTCTVLLDGTRGDGSRAGRSLEASVAAAVCDAEVERRGPLRDRVEQLAAEGISHRRAARATEAAAVAATRLAGS